jgi:hypothetical protein
MAGVTKALAGRLPTFRPALNSSFFAGEGETTMDPVETVEQAGQTGQAGTTGTAPTEKPRRPTGKQLAERKLDEAAAAARAASGEDQIIPVSGAAMENQPARGVLGTGLVLDFKALPIRRTKEVQEAIYGRFPAVILYAVLADRRGTGIDTTKTATYQTRIEAAMGNTDAAAGTSAAVTAEDIEDDVARIGTRLALEADGSPTVGNTTRLVDEMATAIWPLVSSTPGLTEESLPGLMEEHLTVADFADLLRGAFFRLWGA